MTILDHRILIPKSPEKVWEFLSDLTRNPSWQVDCSDVSLLTTRHSGVGVRWRYSTTTGREYVAETTAWYDGLGYEYTFVDGTPFRESKGRIRLQEIAEGTIVQWTLTYEVRGVLAGVRNAMGVKRQFEAVMVDSLRNLWKVIQKAMPEDKPREVKSLMRDAPDYESRIQYKPRHPSTKSDTFPERAEQFVESRFEEPVVSEDDTRPRPVAVTASTDRQGDSTLKPDDRIDLGHEVDSSYRTDSQSIMSGLKPSDLPITKIEEVIENEADISPVKRTTEEYKQVIPPGAPDSSEQVVPSNFGEDTSKLDTAEISVFDIFGLPRPSQTQQIQPISITSEIFPPVESLSEVLPVVPKTRIGLRLQLRHKQIKLRSPQ